MQSYVTVSFDFKHRNYFLKSYLPLKQNLSMASNFQSFNFISNRIIYIFSNH